MPFGMRRLLAPFGRPWAALLHAFLRLPRLGRRGQIAAFREAMADPRIPLGKRGELAAAEMLVRKGWVLLAHGEADRQGEIDLIACRRNPALLAFVEVKTLATRKPGHPADQVDQAKQRRVYRAALRYLKRHRLLGHPCRFDVIAVWWPVKSERSPERIEHLEAAFEAPESWQFY